MVRPPGIDKGGFQLRINNVWFCKVLLLFSEALFLRMMKQGDNNCAASHGSWCSDPPPGPGAPAPPPRPAGPDPGARAGELASSWQCLAP